MVTTASGLVADSMIAGATGDRLARRVRSLAGVPADSVLVHEVYRSIQGESTRAGLPCTFIRLTACHLRCTYCDTRHAFHHGAVMPIAGVVDRVLALGDRLVELTGGEPLLQPGAYPLMARLADAGRSVLVETSGGVDTALVDPRVGVILDVKTPGSGAADANIAANYPRLKAGDEVKYVVTDRADFDWSVAHVREHGLLDRVPVLFGTAHAQVSPTELAAWVLATGLPIRLQVQLHKVLWAPDARGV